MTTPRTLECRLARRRTGTVPYEPRDSGSPKPALPVPAGRIPRISRLMALALRFKQLLHHGTVTNYAELAALGHVSRARITQIMSLLLLAPEIQEALLFLPRTEHGRDPIAFCRLHKVAKVADWQRQRLLWNELHRRGKR